MSSPRIFTVYSALFLIHSAFAASSSADFHRWNQAIERVRSAGDSHSAAPTGSSYWPNYYFGHLNDDFVSADISDGEDSRDPGEASSFFDLMNVPTMRRDLDGGAYDIREILFVGESVMTLTCFEPVGHTYTNRFCSFYWSEGDYSKFERVNSERGTLRARYRRKTANELFGLLVKNHGNHFAWTSSDGRMTLIARSGRFKARIRRK
jgi:hypothetical protein